MQSRTVKRWLAVTKRWTHWIPAALVAGFLLGGSLLVEAVVTYRYVADHLALDHLKEEAGRVVSLVENRAGEQPPQHTEELESLLAQFQQEQAGDIAWMRIAGHDGEILARAGESDKNRVPEQVLQALFARREQRVAEKRRLARSEVLVVTLPFRFRFPSERPGLGGIPGVAGQPKFKVAEVALYLHGAADAFRPVRRNLVVSMASAAALLAALGIIAFRFRVYLRDREFEQQLTVARRVQQELLPQECPACESIDFAAVCVPAWEVGGDYYDVFRTGRGEIALLLGDVSGKGLPAALLMGLLHGAIRAASAAWNGDNHTPLAAQLNDLLCLRTSQDRFVSLFWAFFDPRKGKLRYVNAGHLPPILLRRNASGSATALRLETGGPVLGLLPDATFEQGEVALEDGDLLVLYSDGVVEATNTMGVEFGEARVLQTGREKWDRTARQVQKAILEQVTKFIGREPLRDDMTLLVLRVAATSPTPSGECGVDGKPAGSPK